MQRFLFRHRRISLISVAALALATGSVVFGIWVLPQATLQSRIQAAAKQVMATCANAAYRPSCYDKEIPKFMQNFTMEQTFAITSVVQAQDSSYQYCHVLGHELGAAEVKKDPSKWEEVAARCPAMMCSNGCQHGAFQERFRTDVLSASEVAKLEPEFADLCEAKPDYTPSGYAQASCYHAIGHLLMYVTNADIQTSIGLCQEIALKSDGRDYRQLCYDGVFMQIFQPLEPEDFALVKGKQPTAAQVPGYCAAYPGAPGGSCISESWPLFREQVYTPEGAVKFCDMEAAPYRSRCFDATFSVVTAMLNLDTNKVAAYCAALPSAESGQCFADAADRITQEDGAHIGAAAAFCAQAAADGEGDACYGDLAHHAAFTYLPGSPQFKELCSVLPDPWKAQCMSRAPGI